MTYRDCAHTLDNACLIGVNHSQIQRDPVAISDDCDAQYESMLQHAVEELSLPEQTKSISVMLDRVSLPMEEPKSKSVGRPKRGAPKQPVNRQFRTAYCGTLSWHGEQGTALGSVRLAELPLSGDQIVSQMSHALDKLVKACPEPLRLVTLSDGAEEMANKLRHITKPYKVEMRLIDYWHAVEYLKPAAQEYSSKHADEWFERLKKNLLESKRGVNLVLTHLRTWKYERVGVKSEKIDAAVTYFENHQEWMKYAEAREKGLPVGSGVVEATCKTLVQVRMKRCGMRWKRPGGRGILRLRSAATSAAPFWNAFYSRIASHYVKDLAAV